LIALISFIFDGSHLSALSLIFEHLFGLSLSALIRLTALSLIALSLMVVIRFIFEHLFTLSLMALISVYL
jgi:hypothetical protein